jgi:hypothetical protein
MQIFEALPLFKECSKVVQKSTKNIFVFGPFLLMLTKHKTLLKIKFGVFLLAKQL